LLSQQQPLPESYLLGAPEAVFHNPFGQGSFGREVLDEYVTTHRDPVRVHGICEEYRAAATIDVEHDRVDKEAGKRVECPMLHLWAEGGPLDSFYGRDGGPLGIWRQWAPHAHGQAMKGGHFFSEENPDDTAVLVKQFLSRVSHRSEKGLRLDATIRQSAVVIHIGSARAGLRELASQSSSDRQ
jgi:haloacetate dehalogenase